MVGDARTHFVHVMRDEYLEMCAQCHSTQYQTVEHLSSTAKNK
jgi:hypothetical protein